MPNVSAIVAQHPASPAFPPEGIALAIDLGPSGAATLRGSYRVSLQGFADAKRPLQRHLLFIARFEGEHRPIATMPFREYVMFEGDDRESGGAIHGWFNLSFVELLGANSRPGRWSCRVSLGPVVSNLVVANMGYDARGMGG